MQYSNRLSTNGGEIQTSVDSLQQEKTQGYITAFSTFSSIVQQSRNRTEHHQKDFPAILWQEPAVCEPFEREGKITEVL